MSSLSRQHSSKASIDELRRRSTCAKQPNARVGDPSVVTVTLQQQKERTQRTPPKASKSDWQEPHKFQKVSVAHKAQVPIQLSNKYEALHAKKHTKHASTNLSKKVDLITANLGGESRSGEPEASVGTHLPKQYQDEYSYESDVTTRRLKCHRINGYHRVGQLWYAPGIAVAPLSTGVPVAPPLNPIPQAPPMGGGFKQDQRALALRKHANRVAQIAARASVPREPVALVECYSQRDKDDAPGGNVSEYRERRTVDVHRFTTYEFPVLDFLGWWNDTPYSKSVTELFAEHAGIHFHEQHLNVRIAGDVVVEMMNWWTGKHRDPEGVNYGLSIARCKVLTSEFAINAVELYDTNLYAPALGFMLSWETQQNVSRVQTGAYIKSALPVSVRKSRKALQTRKGKWIAAGLVLGAAAATYGAWRLVSGARSAHVQADSWVRRRFTMPYAAAHASNGVAVQVDHVLAMCVLTPLVEEAIKRIPYIGRFFGIFEFAWSVYNGANPYARLPALIFHNTTLSLPYWQAVLAHGSFNAACMVSASVVVPVPAPRLVGIEPNPGPSVLAGVQEIIPTMLRWVSQCKHVGDRTVQVRRLVNCASLPRPKQLKPKAKVSQGTGELRAPLNLKGPLEVRGKQCVYGFTSQGYAPHGFASNKHNEEQSLYARVLCDTPVPTEDLPACLQWCKKNWRSIFPYMYEVKSVSFETYLERSNASPSVKKTLRACKARLDADGVSEDSKLSRRQLYQYTYRSSFVKVENDLYSSPLGRKDKAPRLIQGAQPEFICLVGPWIMALQDLLKQRWSTANFICFTSGVSAEKAADHVMGGRGRWLEDDLGKFDSSIRRPWCEFEVWLCRRMGAPRAVLDLMTANISTHGSTHHGWRYKCDGTRKSGDPYTSLMNSIVNGLSHLYLYCKWTNKTADQARDSLRMLVQGDDNCMRHAERTKFPWREGMAGLGFDSEAIYRAHPEEVEFCSCRLYQVEGGSWVFGPKPGRVLAKFGYIINPPANVSRESMMRGVALGLKKGCSFIPPINSVIERVLQLTEGHKAWYERKQFAPFAQEEPLKLRCHHKTSIEVLLNLNMNYDWDHGRQMHFDAKVAKLELGDELGDYAQLLYDRDTGGPQVIFGGFAPQQRSEPIGA